MAATRVVRAVSPEGTGYSRAVVGSFEVTRLVFAPSFRHGPVEPERGYMVVVLDGAVTKSFAAGTFTLSRSSIATLPAGATHSSAFARHSTQILAIRPTDEEASALFGALLNGQRHMKASVSTMLGWRMPCELEARDAGWSLALEGLVLELLAATGRVSDPAPARAAGWLRAACDLMHERVPEHPSLTELAAAVGRHPTHVARAFRREHGVTVAEYSRSLRLEWARTQLALGDTSLSRIAIDAGFSDQSHFTRAFRRHQGTTPGRYRELARR
ncbi:hypothetical protein BH20ACT13_BH20ACT13_05010 [soil metagenome]